MKYRYLLGTLFVYASFISSMDIKSSKQNDALVALIKSKIDAKSFDDNQAPADKLLEKCLVNSHGELFKYAIEQESISFIGAFCDYYRRSSDNIDEQLQIVLQTPDLKWNNMVTHTLLETLATGIHKESDPPDKFKACLKVLRHHNIDLNCTDEEGISLLHKLVDNNLYTCVEHLITAGCNASIALHSNGRAPLYFAGNVRMIELLFNKGNAKIDARDLLGNTPLHIIAKRRKESSKLIRSLVGHGANINAQNASGLTPLHIAISKHRYWAICTLLDLEADFSIKNDEGFSAIPVIRLSVPTVKQIHTIEDIV